MADSPSTPARAVFMGSPVVAVPSLHALAAHPDVRLVGAVTQPDRPAGRRRQAVACPVRQAAEALGVPVMTPIRIRDDAAVAGLRAWAPDLVIVCAYGQLLSEAVLQVPPLGCYNLHFSLLPRWRGASPVQAALLAGDATTGVSLQRVVLELDAGDVVGESPAVSIGPDETAEQLSARLAEEAARLLTTMLPALVAGNAPGRPQAADAVTFCHRIRKQDGAVDFVGETAAQIERKLRAFTPWPGCYAFIAGRRLGLVRVETVADPADTGAGGPRPGELTADGWVRTADGWLRLLQVRPEGKAAMDFASYRNGYPAAVGQLLTPTPG